MNGYMLDVERGAAVLDELKPGWEALVHLGTLDLMDPTRCVLGQVFAEEAGLVYCGYEYAVMLQNGPLRRLYDDVQAYGFCGSSNRLLEAWVEFIGNRRLGVAA